MNVFWHYFKRLDWILIISAVLVTLFGLGAIYSSSLAKGNFLNFEKQIVFFIVGFCLMMIMALFDYRVLRNNSYLILVIYFISLILLAGTFFLGPEIRGTRHEKTALKV